MELIGITITTGLLFFALYGIVLVVAGSTFRRRTHQKSDLPPIKVLLPAYRPDRIFLTVLESLERAKKDYPIEVFILFQHADEHLVEASKAFGFRHEEKHFDHLPGNSYRHALQYLCTHHLNEEVHPYTLILDKDNLVDPTFFDQLATAQVTNYHLVQGARKPLKTTEGIQLFDAISEKYNDLMLRKGKLQLGGALEVSGSAAVIQTALFKGAIMHMDEHAPGYDKNFMVKLLTSDVQLRTTFVEDMIVYEEKTSEIQNYQSQRLRWFGEQYFNAFYNFKPLILSTLTKGKLRSLDYWFTLIRPPRSIQLVITALLVPLDLFDGALSYLSTPFLLNLISFGLVALPIMQIKQVSQLINGTISVLLSNLVTSLICLQKKYQNTFIHTR